MDRVRPSHGSHLPGGIRIFFRHRGDRDLDGEIRVVELTRGGRSLLPTHGAVAEPDDLVRMFEPKDINVVVAGGETQGAWKMIGARYEKTISVDAWR